MGRTIVAILLALCAAAHAKPLPKGMKVSLVGDVVKVSQGGASVPLFEDLRYPVTKVVKAELTADGKSIEVQIDACDNMWGDSETPRQAPLAHVQARLENALGMSFHTKKKYADAIAHFNAAIAADPQPVYVTNLLSAQAMSGKLDDADKTLAAWGKKHAPWIVWRLAVDPELKKLVGRPSAKLATDKPGKALSSLDKKLAVSPLGFAATETTADSPYEGTPGEYSTDVVFVDLATGSEVLRLPAETYCDESGMDGSTPAQLKKCQKKAKAAAVKTRKVIDAVLAQLGFEEAKNAYRDPKTSDPIKTPEGKTFTVPDDAGDVWAIWFLPKHTVYELREKIMSDCVGGGELHMSLDAKPR
jgi:hypothetical protein